MSNPRFNIKKEFRQNTILSKGKTLFYLWKTDEEGMVLFELVKEKTYYPVNYKNKLYFIQPWKPFKVIDATGFYPAGSLSSNIKERLTIYEKKHPQHIVPTGFKHTTPGLANDDFENDNRFDLVPGTILSNNNKSYIYLFSSHGRGYGITEDQLNCPIPILLKIKGFRGMSQGRIIPEELVINSAQRLGQHNLKCSWLPDSLSQYYSSATL